MDNRKKKVIEPSEEFKRNYNAEAVSKPEEPASEPQVATPYVDPIEFAENEENLDDINQTHEQVAAMAEDNDKRLPKMMILFSSIFLMTVFAIGGFMLYSGSDNEDEVVHQSTSELVTEDSQEEVAENTSALDSTPPAPDDCPVVLSNRDLFYLDTDLFKQCTLANATNPTVINEWGIKLKNNSTSRFQYDYDETSDSVSISSRKYAEYCDNEGKLGLDIVRAKSYEEIPAPRIAYKDVTDYPQYILDPSPSSSWCPVNPEKEEEMNVLFDVLLLESAIYHEAIEEV